MPNLWVMAFVYREWLGILKGSCLVVTSASIERFLYDAKVWSSVIAIHMKLKFIPDIQNGAYIIDVVKLYKYTRLQTVKTICT